MDSDSNHQQQHQNQEEEETVKINETVAQQQQDDEQKVNSRIKTAEIDGEIAIKIGEGEGGGDPAVPDHDVDIMIDIDGDDLIFSDNAFPSLPDFPCLSSPSASSATNLRKNPSISTSSSSSSSSSSSAWPFLPASGQPQEPYMHGSDVMVPTPSEEATTETDIFGDIELWDSSDALDPSFLFPDDYDTAIQDPLPLHCDPSATATVKEDDDKNSSNPSGELAKIFLDWLKSNRDSISPEDLRSIKLKKSTIECAATRLGGGKEGRTQLLKLILAWVQNHHLQKKKQRRLSRQEMETETGAQFYNNCGHQQSLSPPAYPHYQFPLLSDAGTNPNPNPCHEYNCEPTWTMHYPVDNPIPVSALPCISESQVYQSAPVAPYHYYQTASTSSIVVNSQPFSPSPDFGHVFSPPPMHFSPFAAGPGLHPIPHYPVGYNSQYSMYPSPTFTGAASATKEARKKRMARQRRFSALHQHRNHQNHNNRDSSLTAAAAAAVEKANLRVVTEGGSSLSAQNSNNNSKSWAFWSAARQKSVPTDAPAGSASLPAKTSNMQPAQSQSQSRNMSSSEKRQGLKSEKNLRFLLQKVLKQSDVGSLGRIVLPKKEAEIHLPELDARDGISIPMEDIGTSRVWNMKYRFWPNNKSRMYLLENTGDFVRSNGLQEGDFIVIYSDVKCNKYMIRGVKVRQQPERKGAGGSRLDAAKAYLPKKNSSDLAQRSCSTSRTEAAACDDSENYDNENDVVEHPCYSEEDGYDASP